MSVGEWYVSEAGGGRTIADFDTFLGLRFKTGSALPVMPLENGSFFTANKWMTPYNAQVELARSGNQTELNNMMVMLERYKNSTDLVDIVTPYFTFIHGNIYDIEYDFGVDQTGVGMVNPYISIQEVRLIQESTTSTTDISAARMPEHNSTVNAGKQTPREEGARRDFNCTPTAQGALL